MKAELKIKSFLKAINEFHIAEQQPCGVQVVEWVGLVVFSCSMNRTGGLITDSPYGVSASPWTRGHTVFEVFP